MAKSFAYTSQLGGLAEKVTANQIERRRRDEFHGEPTGQIFYSSHTAGNRKQVKHVMKGGKSYFSYINNDGSGGGVGGESLNHQLFKEALISVKHACLHLIFNSSTRARRQENVSVTITHAESEKKLVTKCGRDRFVDVYLRFETESNIGLKWEQELYLEVCSTHAVDAEKQTDLRALSVPVVEVEIPDIFVYKYSDENTTDEREAAHKTFIKKVLEGDTGFLRCRVLSDPSSKPYLEKLVVLQQTTISELRLKNTELQGKCAEVSSRLEATESAFEVAETKGDSVLEKLGRLTEVHSVTSRQLAVVKNELVQVEIRNGELQGEIENLTDALSKKIDEQKNTQGVLNKLKITFAALSTKKQDYLIQIRWLWMGMIASWIVASVSTGLLVSGVKISSLFKGLLGS